MDWLCNYELRLSCVLVHVLGHDLAQTHKAISNEAVVDHAVNNNC